MPICLKLLSHLLVCLTNSIFHDSKCTLHFLFRKRRVNPLQDRSGCKLFRFGNSELDELWSRCPDNLEACRNKERLFDPSDLGEYFETAILELDPREKVEEQYK